MNLKQSLILKVLERYENCIVLKLTPFWHFGMLRNWQRFLLIIRLIFVFLSLVKLRDNFVIQKSLYEINALLIAEKTSATVVHCG